MGLTDIRHMMWDIGFYPTHSLVEGFIGGGI